MPKRTKACHKKFILIIHRLQMKNSQYICSMKQFLKDLFTNQSYDEKNFFLIAGPCVIEDEALLNEVAEKVSAICKRLNIAYIFKSSYRKANRTSATSFTGLGDETGLTLLKKIRDT